MGILNAIFGRGCCKYLRWIQEDTDRIRTDINQILILERGIMSTLTDLNKNMDALEQSGAELATLYTDLRDSIGEPTQEQQALIDQADATATRLKDLFDTVKVPTPTDPGTEPEGEPVAGGFARRSTGVNFDRSRGQQSQSGHGAESRQTEGRDPRDHRSNR